MPEYVTRLALRPATSDDSAMLLDWRNRPEIYRLGASNRMVTEDEHAAWMSKMLSDDASRVFVIEEDDSPVGQIRFVAMGPRTSTVSIFLLPEHQGRGLGRDALAMGCATAFAQLDIDAIDAEIIETNTRSLSFFRDAHFETVGTDHGVVKMVLRRPSQ